MSLIGALFLRAVKGKRGRNRVKMREEYGQNAAKTNKWTIGQIFGKKFGGNCQKETEYFFKSGVAISGKSLYNGFEWWKVH